MNINVQFIKFSRMLVILLFVSACSQTSTDEYMKEANKELKQQSYRNAIIALKNVLQKEPSNKEARKLIGKVYLRVGDGDSAEKEFERYIKYGGDQREVTLLLGKVFLVKHEYKKALKKIIVNDSVDKVGAYILRGKAHMGLHHLGLAREAFNNALASKPDSQEAWLGLAEVKLVAGKYHDTEDLISRVLELNPSNTDAWYLKGIGYIAQNQTEKAVQSFKKAVELLNGKLYGQKQFNMQVSLIRALIRNNQYDKTKQYMDTLSKYFPKLPETLYLKGLIAYLGKDFEQAENSLYEVTKKVPDHMPTLLLLGSLHYMKHNFEQANEYLTKFVNNTPTHLQARKLLAVVRVKLNRQSEALDILKATDKKQYDDELIKMIGRIAIDSGQEKYAVKFLKEAINKKPDDTSIRSTLALAYMKKGQYENAIQQLEALTDIGQQKKVILIDAYLRQGKLKKAQLLVNELVKENPNNEITKITAAVADLYSGKRSSARLKFSEALEINPDSIHALLYMANMDIEDGKLTDSQELYDHVLALQPDNVQAYVGLAQIEERRGRKKQAISLLKEISEINTTSTLPALILGKYFLNRRDFVSAREILLKVNDLHKNNVEISVLLSRAYQGAGEGDRSIRLLQNLIKTQKSNSLVYIELAGILESKGKKKKAREYLELALKLSPDSVRARRALGIVELNTGNIEQAKKIASQMQSDKRSAFTGYTLSGDIFLDKKQYKKAQKSYRHALSIKPNRLVLLKLYNAYHLAGQSGQALKVVENWVSRFPADLSMGLGLANLYTMREKPSLAIAQYKRMLKFDPNHVPSLNNLADLISKQDQNLALTYARKAYELESRSPAIQDTLGWIYIQKGDLKEGLPLLQKAARQLTRSSSVQYHLAVALYKMGEKRKALGILADIMKSNHSFPEKKQVIKLKNKLSDSLNQG